MKTGGIDVCPAGYFGISLDENNAGYWLLEDDTDFLNFIDGRERIFVDIPIGLQDNKNWRKCDRLLQERLGADYKDDIISPPIREALYAPTYAEASMISYETMDKRLTMQAWSMAEDIRFVDKLLQDNSELQERILESYPELLFQILNGNSSILQKRSTKKGLRHRLHLLKQQTQYADDFFRDSKEEFRRNQVKEKNILDTLVLALLALRSVDQPIKTLPGEPPIDATGLPMAIHYV